MRLTIFNDIKPFLLFLFNIPPFIIRYEPMIKGVFQSIRLF